jgi:hypothetical protein
LFISEKDLQASLGVNTGEPGGSGQVDSLSEPWETLEDSECCYHPCRKGGCGRDALLTGLGQSEAPIKPSKKIWKNGIFIILFSLQLY